MFSQAYDNADNKSYDGINAIISKNIPAEDGGDTADRFFRYTRGNVGSGDLGTVLESQIIIQNLSDEEVATQMGFKSTESGRKAGYKQIKNLRKTLKEKAARILEKKGIAFLGDENEII